MSGKVQWIEGDFSVICVPFRLGNEESAAGAAANLRDMSKAAARAKAVRAMMKRPASEKSAERKVEETA